MWLICGIIASTVSMAKKVSSQKKSVQKKPASKTAVKKSNKKVVVRKGLRPRRELASSKTLIVWSKEKLTAFRKTQSCKPVFLFDSSRK